MSVASEHPTRPRPGLPAERTLAVVAFLVAMLAFLAHRTAAGALGPGDEARVLEHEAVRDASVDGALELVRGSWASGPLAAAEETGGARFAGRPLAWLSLQLDGALGAGPRDLSRYRRTSAVLHALVAGLVVVLLALLFADVWAAGAAGLAFALHPVAVEPVLWLSERGTVLGAFLALVAAVAHVRGAMTGARAANVLAVLAYALALLADPFVALLPLALLALDAWPLARLSVRTALGKLPLLALGGAALWLSGATTSSMPRLARCVNEIAAAAALLVRPGEPSIVEPRVGAELSLAGLGALELSLLGAGAVLVLVGLVLRRRVALALAVGAAWFLALLAPTQGVADGVGASSLAYLPAVGLALVVGAWLAELARPGRALALRRALLVLVAACLALPLASATRRAQGRWTTPEALAEHAVRRAPDQGAAHELHARALLRAGRRDEAVRAYQDALASDPFRPAAWDALGELLLARGDVAGAVEAWESAVGLFPEDARFPRLLSGAVERVGDDARALALLEQAVELDPDDALARHALGARLLARGDAAAEEHLAAAVRLRPRWVQARASHARLLIAERRWEEARAELEAGLELDPGDHELHANLAVALAELGDAEAALRHTEEAARQRSDRADVQHNLANALARAGRPEEALAAYDRALAIEPELLPSVVNRAMLLDELGRRDEALRGLERACELAPENEELRAMLERMRAGR